MDDLKSIKYDEKKPYHFTKTDLIKGGYIFNEKRKPVAKYYNVKSRTWIKLYDVRRFKKKVRKRHISPEKQAAAVEKQKATRLKNRTCSYCEEVQSYKIKKIYEGKYLICNICYERRSNEKSEILEKLNFQRQKEHITRVVGIYYETSREELAERIIDKVEKNEKVELILEREPENPFDKNAVVVLFEGEKLGFLEKKLAAKISIKLKKQKERILIELIPEDTYKSISSYTYGFREDLNEEIHTSVKYNIGIKISIVGR